MNVVHETYDYTSNNWSHWNSDSRFKEKFGSCTRKSFHRFTIKDSYTWNITHNTESTAVWNLKTERWGSPLVQEKYREEKPVTRDDDDNDNNNNIYIYRTRQISVISRYFEQVFALSRPLLSGKQLCINASNMNQFHLPLHFPIFVPPSFHGHKARPRTLGVTLW